MKGGAENNLLNFRGYPTNFAHGAHQQPLGRRGSGSSRSNHGITHSSHLPQIPPVETRFLNTNSRAELAAPEAEFSDVELSQISAFAKLIAMDFGELDVLRDRDSHRIYIVDANKTPFGPPNHLPNAQQVRVLDLLAEAFAAEFLTNFEGRQ